MIIHEWLFRLEEQETEQKKSDEMAKTLLRLQGVESLEIEGRQKTKLKRDPGPVKWQLDLSVKLLSHRKILAAQLVLALFLLACFVTQWELDNNIYFCGKQHSFLAQCVVFISQQNTAIYKQQNLWKIL